MKNRLIGWISRLFHKDPPQQPMFEIGLRSELQPDALAESYVKVTTGTASHEVSGFKDPADLELDHSQFPQSEVVLLEDQTDGSDA